MLSLAGNVDEESTRHEQVLKSQVNGLGLFPPLYLPLSTHRPLLVHPVLIPNRGGHTHLSRLVQATDFTKMAGNNGAQVPRFGDWKATDGGGQFTMYFENARQQRRTTSGAIAPHPRPPPARMDTAPAAGRSRTPPRGANASPGKPKDRTNRSPSYGTGGSGGSVPAWGKWNEGNSGGDAQQYTIVFDQLREERKSAPPTPSMEQLKQPTPSQLAHRDLYDHVPKKFTCFGLCLK
ncbi:hypothetical protein ACP70R_002522 [Stipagrostis hirtigluma subsp. patula]